MKETQNCTSTCYFERVSKVILLQEQELTMFK